MRARLVKFGEIEVEGKRYTHDVVIDGGKVRKRKKGPSKQFREKFDHTPLSAGEKIPWGGKRLIIGTGAHGALPVMDEVLAEAKRRGIEVIDELDVDAHLIGGFLDAAHQDVRYAKLLRDLGEIAWL